MRRSVGNSSVLKHQRKERHPLLPIKRESLPALPKATSYNADTNSIGQERTKSSSSRQKLCSTQNYNAKSSMNPSNQNAHVTTQLNNTTSLDHNITTSMNQSLGVKNINLSLFTQEFEPNEASLEDMHMFFVAFQKR